MVWDDVHFVGMENDIFPCIYFNVLRDFVILFYCWESASHLCGATLGVPHYMARAQH